MDLYKFNDLIVKIHNHTPLTQAEKAYIKEDLPSILVDIPTIHTVREYIHPVGVRLTGAPPRSYITSYALILAKKAFGTRELIDHPLYETIEKDLTLHIMRGSYEYDRPKGYYCCKICTMAVFPLFDLNLLHLISGKQIAEVVRQRIIAREPFFTQGVPAKLIDFTLSFQDQGL